MKQAQTFQGSISNIEIFQRCPTCKYNIIRHYCSMSCGVNQMDFLTALEKKEHGNVVDKG